jgi:Arc/MetJ-type ribon-helix-helix transcriptional regulator
MAKKGRPFEYQSEEERPVTVSLRIPRELYEPVQQRVQLRRTTLTEAIKDALGLWLEKPLDPRDLISSDDNTVIRELEEMVEAAVQRALAKERAALGALDTSTSTPASEAAPQPGVDLSYNDNTVLQEEAPQRSPRRGGLKLTPQQAAALRAKRQQGTPIKALVEEYGISRATVHRYLQEADALGG